MRRTSQLIIAGLISLGAQAYSQITIKFDHTPLTPNTFYNGSDEAGGFNIGRAHFKNDYNATYDFWSGFALSKIYDGTTAGFANQYGVLGGTDRSGTGAFAIGFDNAFGEESDVITFPIPIQTRGIYLNNTTYTGLSMLLGDAFAKKFGGTNGTDPDFFLLQISGKNEAGETTGIVDFYLADFRSSNPDDDYIISDWTWVDLRPLGQDVKTLHFQLSSSDIGNFGMNTPAYFAMDDLSVAWGGTWRRATDLSIQSITPSTLDNNNRISVATTIKNYGGNPTSGKAILLIKSTAYNRYAIRKLHVPTLAPEEEITLTFSSVKVPSQMLPGTFETRLWLLPKGYSDLFKSDNYMTLQFDR